MINDVGNNNYEYFDENYYQNGSTRGTAYKNYLNESQKSPIYQSVAQTIYECFHPKRCLEIGCATGVIVNYLRSYGIESYGIDVSRWCIENKVNENIILAGAENIPFPENYFDLIYSVHALEHLPNEYFHSGLREMDRVCKGGIQFHMLPIVGTYPYSGEKYSVIENLSKDKTHFQLHTKEEWKTFFLNYGWKLANVFVPILNDTENYDLTMCQLVLSKTNIKSNYIDNIYNRQNEFILKLISESNQIKLISEQNKIFSFNEMSKFILIKDEILLPKCNDWHDIEIVFDDEKSKTKDLQNKKIYCIVKNYGNENIELRIALVAYEEGGAQLTDCNMNYANVFEQWFRFQPGITQLYIESEKLKILRGNPSLKLIHKVLFGGLNLHADIGVCIKFEE